MAGIFYFPRILLCTKGGGKKRNDTNPLAWNNRGLAYFYLKNYKKAEADCLQSLKYKSGNADAYLNLGRIYLAQGKKVAACENLTKASDLQNK